MDPLFRANKKCENYEIHKDGYGCAHSSLGFDAKAKGNVQACIKSNIKKGHRYVEITSDYKCYGGHCTELEKRNGSTIFDVTGCMGKRKLNKP